MTHRIRLISVVLLITVATLRGQAQAQERLCDPSVENCRTPLLDLIRNETQRIDVAFWLMEDSRYTTALVAARNRGVPVRVLVDTKANTVYLRNADMIRELQNGGIPIRRTVSRYLHWKFMLFAGQNMVQFGSSNFTPHAFAYVSRLTDFIDETIFFTNDAAIVNSFKTKFDDNWVSTNAFTNYANVSGPLTRAYPVHAISSAMNFPPSQDFGARAVGRYNAEGVGIDVVTFRLGDRRHADAVIAAHQRGVPVRMYIEQGQYRDPKRPWSAYDTDRLYVAGIPLRQRRHAGWNHQKLVLLHGQRMAIFGSQNWTHTPGQYEHNYFTTQFWLYQALRDQFNRKWNSSTETTPFVPQPPTTPSNRSPASGAQVNGSQVTLRWYAGVWAHKYDIYFGTSSNPPRIATNVELGFSSSSSDLKSYTVTGLRANTTYYWRIVSKTMANLSRGGSIWSFRTGS